jgi:hypothetical protein
VWATQEQNKWRLSEERKREGGDKNKKRIKGRSNGQKKKKGKHFAQYPLGGSICKPSQKAPEPALWTIGVAFIGLHVSHNTHKSLISHMFSTFNRGK